MALRALAEAMTGAIHFVLGAKPTQIGQLGFFMPQFPTGRFITPVLWNFKPHHLRDNRFFSGDL
jgi:hypothetical protein